jgi:hypothetical protein
MSNMFVAAIITIAQLHEKISDCFSLTKNTALEENLLDEKTDERFNLEAMRNMATVEHIWTTFDWTRLLLDEHHPEGRAFSSIENICQHREPDVFRPHCWHFGLDQAAVVLNVKHWSADKEYWNESPMPLWKRVPDIVDIIPCKLGHTSKPLVEAYAALTACDAHYHSTQVRCRERCEQAGCKMKLCLRCEHMEVVGQYTKLAAVMDVSEADCSWWEQHFDHMTQAHVDMTLPSKAKMVLRKCVRAYGDCPSVQEQIDALPAMMKAAPKGLKCKQAVNGWDSKIFKAAVKQCKRNKPGVDVTEVESVVGATRSKAGKVEYAIIRVNGEGAWITAKELSLCQEADLELGDRDDPTLIWFCEGADMTHVLVQESSNRMYLATMKAFQESTGTWELLYEEQANDSIFGTFRCEREIQNVDLQTLQIVKHKKQAGTEHDSAGSKEGCVIWRDIAANYDSGTWIRVKEKDGYKRAKMYKHRSSSQVVLWQPGTRCVASTLEGHDPAYSLKENVMRDSVEEEIVFRYDSKRARRESDGSGESESDKSDSEIEQTGQPEFHNFWVNREYFGMEFIQKKLKIISVGGEPVNIAEVRRCHTHAHRHTHRQTDTHTHTHTHTVEHKTHSHTHTRTHTDTHAHTQTHTHTHTHTHMNTHTHTHTHTFPLLTHFPFS